MDKEESMKLWIRHPCFCSVLLFLVVLLWSLNCRRLAANWMLAWYWRQLFRNLNSLRNVTIWIFISTLCSSLCWSITGSEGWFGFFFPLIRSGTRREALGSEQRTMLWSAKSHQGWRRVRCFQTSFSLSFVHLVYRLPLEQEVEAPMGRSEELSLRLPKALKSQFSLSWAEGCGLP